MPGDALNMLHLRRKLFDRDGQLLVVRGVVCLLNFSISVSEFQYFAEMSSKNSRLQRVLGGLRYTNEEQKSGGGVVWGADKVGRKLLGTGEKGRGDGLMSGGCWAAQLNIQT